MKLLLRWVLNALVLLLIARYYDGVELTGFYPALITILLLGLVNAIIRPILILLTLPVTILSLGLFTLVINAALFWFVSSFVQGFTVHGFVGAFVGALLMSIGSWFIARLLKSPPRHMRHHNG